MRFQLTLSSSLLFDTQQKIQNIKHLLKVKNTIHNQAKHFTLT